MRTVEDGVVHDHSVDIRGMCCSAPVIRLTKELKPLPPAAIVLVVSDKVSMLNDIPAYCQQTGHELLRQEERDCLFHFWIRKA